MLANERPGKNSNARGLWHQHWHWHEDISTLWMDRPMGQVSEHFWGYQKIMYYMWAWSEVIFLLLCLFPSSIFLFYWTALSPSNKSDKYSLQKWFVPALTLSQDNNIICGTCHTFLTYMGYLLFTIDTVMYLLMVYVKWFNLR